MGSMLSRGLVGVAVLNDECLEYPLLLVEDDDDDDDDGTHLQFFALHSQSVSDDPVRRDLFLVWELYDETNDVCVSVCH